MSSRLRSLGAASLLAAAAFAIYSAAFTVAPPSTEESAILRLAATIGDQPFRLFFQVDGERWLQPIPVYLTAVAGLVAPADHAARYATAAIGTLDVVLMFVLGGRIFNQWLAGVGAALLLLATPAHFVHARLGTDAIYIVPFVLIWMISLFAHVRHGRDSSAVAAAFSLGAGVYTQPAAPLTMAFLLLVTLAVIRGSGRGNVRSMLMTVSAFALPVAGAAAWYLANPQTYADTFGRWFIHAAHLRFPLDGLSAFVNWTTLGTRVSLYWGLFDPSWLFFGGPADSHTALEGRAPFLSISLPLIAAGVAWSLRATPVGVATLLLAGLAASPLAASTLGQPHAIASAMAVVPFVVVLGMGGLVSTLQHHSLLWRCVGWFAIAASVIEFGRFQVAYLR